MQLTAVYRGGDDPFEGDRVVAFRALPVGAVVRRATLTLTPTGAAAAPPRQPFEEVFVFGAPRDGELAAAEWGVTALTSGAALEVDLHARRTLAAVAGAHVGGSTLTVDVGGLFVELNTLGAVRSPDDTAFTVPATGVLPGVTVPRFRLIGTVAATPSVDMVSVRSAPANVSVGLGTMGPFWAHMGELAAPEQTPDFADALQAFLLEADVENGVYVVPFGVHADGIARLDLALELEFVLERSLLPEGLPDVTLPFELSTFARTSNGPLSARLPAGAEVIPGSTAASVRGGFEATRIAPEAGTGDETPTAEAVVSGDRLAAQPVEASGDVVLTGLDLYLAPLSPAARLDVTLLGDSDGKPFGDPLLPAPLEARLSREESRAAQWVTVPLTEEFNVEGGGRYWLVLQAVEGEASWQATSAAAGTAPLQASTDSGLSWSTATDAHVTGPLTAFHRLRVTPAGFRMPISLEVGAGEAKQHVSLRRFEPLGRVEFTIDTPELANAFASALAATGVACPTAEHVVNGEFDQWIGIGDELRSGGFISLVGSPRALALTADGTRAYAASFAAGTGELTTLRPLLEPIELACAEAGTPIELDPGELPIEPIFVAVAERAGRAFVVGELDGEARLLIADLGASARIGQPVSLDPYTGFAVDPTGERLLLLRRQGTNAVIEALDVRTAERLAREGTGALSAAVTPVATVPLRTGESLAGGLPAPCASGSAEDGPVLAFGLDGHTAGARLCLVGIDGTPRFVDIGRIPVAIAATRDGARIVVACAGDQTLRVVSSDAVEARRPIVLDATPVAVALSAEGRRAAVLSAADVAVYDLDNGRRLSSTPVGAAPVAVVGSPRLDALVVAESEGGGVARVAAPAVPLEWTLTSGAVEPRCFAGDLAALLGRRSRNHGKEDGATVHREPSAISQVVPVAGGCRYEFSFRALADQSESVGEVLWRGDDCTLARADSIPIVEFEPSSKDRDAEAEPRLLLHRKALEPPLGTRQAEVRFTVPPGGLAAVGFVSLKGSDAVGINADLRQRENGRAVGWSVDSGGAELTLGPSESGVVVANEEVETGALVQRATVVPGRRLVVELVGRVTGGGADPSPRLVVRLFDADDASVGDPAIAPLPPQSFDHVLLAAEVPGEAVQVEVRLELPAAARVELERIALRQEQDVEVPLVFRAEAPGELAVSTARVAFDTRDAPAPSVPPTGLCAPTAPGAEPGAEAAPACGCCGAHEAADESRAVVTPAGRPAVLGRCAHCGCRTVMASGSPRVRAAPTLAPSRTLGHARGAGLPAERAVTAAVLTDVEGIGPIRARRLARVGIATVDRLAGADTRVVAAVLGNVSSATARRVIASAIRHSAGL